MARVFLSKKFKKNVKKLQLHIHLKLYKWVDVAEKEAYKKIREITGYKDHMLIGDRKNQRSSYLSKHYRVVYEIIEGDIKILEVTKHEYKK